MNNDNKKIFGSNLREILRKKNISQAELSRIMKVGRATVTRWVKAEKYPPFETLLKLVKELDVSANELIPHTEQDTIYNIDTILRSRFTDQLLDYAEHLGIYTRE